MRGIGIDLGTTHSLVSCDINGEIRVLADEQGDMLQPSVVRYVNQEIIVGKAALSGIQTDPQHTFSSVKRLMGKTTDTKPVEVSAEILKKMRQIAQRYDQSIHSAVITVPAYFDDAQRQATKDAAQLAGIDTLRLLNEPTAAAIAYGLDTKAQGKCFVFDLGGGTFDVSILMLNQGVFEVIATGGDTVLGGDDMDHLIAEWALAQSNLAQEAINYSQLLYQARLAKEVLSSQDSSEILSCVLTVERLNDLISPLVERMLQICTQVLKDAKLQKEEMDHIILVGGATRIPYLQQQVKAFFNREVLNSIDPDKVVCLGAGIQASILSGHRPDLNLLLLDVLPLSLGIEMMGGLVEKILPRNTPVPAVATQRFTTYEDGQTGFVLHVVQGERALVKDCRSLAHFDLTDLPPQPAGMVKLEVTFQVDVDGLLSVEAKELLTGKQAKIEVKPTYGLSQETIQQLIQESMTDPEGDSHRRKLVEKINTAKRVLSAIDKAVVSDGDLLTLEAGISISDAMENLKSAIANEDLLEITEFSRVLEDVAQDFMAQRLQASLDKALMDDVL